MTVRPPRPDRYGDRDRPRGHLRVVPNHHDDAEWRMVRDEAESVKCPRCEAPPQTHCRNPITGQELHRAPAHHQRIRAAQETADG